MKNAILAIALVGAMSLLAAPALASPHGHHGHRGHHGHHGRSVHPHHGWHGGGVHVRSYHYHRVPVYRQPYCGPYGYPAVGHPYYGVGGSYFRVQSPHFGFGVGW